MSIEKMEGMFIPVCDKCDKELSGFYDTFYEAVEAKKEAGWKSRKVDGEFEDWCDECCEGGK